MAFKHLLALWQSEKFPSSWIIGTSDLNHTLIEVTKFAAHILSAPDGLPIENNPDFRIIRREKNSTGELTKFIAVDQIRKLQNFLNTTNSLSKYKIALIEEADLMNINASNCCLKILEDTPRNSFIFLLTSSPHSLIDTIKSRCHKIYLTDQNKSQKPESYETLISYLTDHSAFLKTLTGKVEKETFSSLGQSALYLLNQAIKYNNTPLQNNPKQILLKYDRINKIISDTIKSDLDPKNSLILMIEELLS